MQIPWIEQILKSVSTMTQCSDLIIEPLHDGQYIARLRRGGVYQDLETAPAEESTASIPRLKALAGVPAYIMNEAQDGRIDGTAFGFAGDLRAAFIPTVRGQRAAIRLPAMGNLPTPENIGLPTTIVDGLRKALRMPQGLVLICGPTGSGKTTTIHSFISELAQERRDRQCLAIEDPVERHLPNIVQIEINTHLHYGFSEALRASLRQDPDVIIIGEIRDPETAQAAVRASLSGHLVISTLHCGEAKEVIPRLIEMGVQTELLLPTLSAVLAQRLIRTIHQNCHGNGCNACNGGYDKRHIVADWCVPDHDEKSAWVQGIAPPLIENMHMQARALIDSGDTDLQEVERVIESYAC